EFAMFAANPSHGPCNLHMMHYSISDLSTSGYLVCRPLSAGQPWYVHSLQLLSVMTYTPHMPLASA
ncbi:hypothetical protein, partial [Escherichia coli]|uniref:hypothetical protein n=1 Tax=Escherichia coli TaxID=562 RepID=UPI0039E1DC32